MNFERNMKKIILLTGASSGIGKSIAEILSNKGYLVIATVRKEQDKINLEAINSNIKVFFADVTVQEDLAKLKQDLFNQNIKSIDGIINNAGLAYSGIMECADIDDLKAQFDVNTFAPLRVIKEFLPMMQEGKIINISSVSSNVVYPFIAPYCASKKSLDIFFQALDIEIDNPKIKIVSIKPGVVKTPIWDKSHNLTRNKFEKLPENIKAKYQNALDKMLAMSEKSIGKGMNVELISNLVLKILKTKNPKMSYTIGLNSVIGAYFAKLPIDLQNIFAKFVLKRLLK